MSTEGKDDVRIDPRRGGPASGGQHTRSRQLPTGPFGPLFLGIIGIVALFFLFTREITKFVQFLVLAIAIGVVFYTPGIVKALATGIASALGVH